MLYPRAAYKAITASLKKPIADFTWPTSAAGWAALSGWTAGNIEHSYAFGESADGTVIDQIGSSDLDDISGIGVMSNQLTWPGNAGGLAFGATSTNTGHVASTDTNVLAPGTDNFSVFWEWYRPAANDSSSANRCIWSTNANDEGLRVIQRNFAPTTTWIQPTMENQVNTARNAQMSTVDDLFNGVMHHLVTRNSSTTGEVWGGLENDGDVFHEDFSGITGTDDFTEGGGVLQIGGGTPGQWLENNLIKQFVYAREGSAQSNFEALHGTTITSVTEI